MASWPFNLLWCQKKALSCGIQKSKWAQRLSKSHAASNIQSTRQCLHATYQSSEAWHFERYKAWPVGFPNSTTQLQFLEDAGPPALSTYWWSYSGIRVLHVTAGPLHRCACAEHTYMVWQRAIWLVILLPFNALYYSATMKNGLSLEKYSITVYRFHNTSHIANEKKDSPVSSWFTKQPEHKCPLSSFTEAVQARKVLPKLPWTKLFPRGSSQCFIYENNCTWWLIIKNVACKACCRLLHVQQGHVQAPSDVSAVPHLFHGRWSPWETPLVFLEKCRGKN